MTNERVESDNTCSAFPLSVGLHEMFQSGD
jgi:hypothetical protein